MVWKNREESYPKWYEKNKNRLNKKKRERRKMDKEYRNRLQKQARRRYSVGMKKVMKELKGRCVFCKSIKKLRVHEIHGLEHDRSPYYILNHLKDFALLCYKCHWGVHWLMKYFGMEWEEIKMRLPLKGNNNE